MIDIFKDTYTEKLLDFILTTFLATHRIQPPVQNKSSSPTIFPFFSIQQPICNAKDTTPTSKSSISPCFSNSHWSPRWKYHIITRGKTLIFCAFVSRVESGSCMHRPVIKDCPCNSSPPFLFSFMKKSPYFPISSCKYHSLNLKIYFFFIVS